MFRFLLTSLLLLSTFSFADEVTDKCGTHPDLYRDTAGSPVWFTADQMQQRASDKSMPEPVSMPQLSFTGVVSMKVMIGKSGNLLCMWDVAGHPIMIPNAVRAAHQWKFKPLQKDGHAVEYVGVLKVPVSTRQ